MVFPVTPSITIDFPFELEKLELYKEICDPVSTRKVVGIVLEFMTILSVI